MGRRSVKKNNIDKIKGKREGRQKTVEDNTEKQTRKKNNFQLSCFTLCVRPCARMRESKSECMVLD